MVQAEAKHISHQIAVEKKATERQEEAVALHQEVGGISGEEIGKAGEGKERCAGPLVLNVLSVPIDIAWFGELLVSKAMFTFLNI
ncbi:hypothetical protein EK904_014263 [Melospiza melodia maxima]|nr:hypothetical protein EK904_014263 [Melospiza melodia maxima]